MCMDLEPCAVWRSRFAKARKAQRCMECGEVIPPKERYRRTNWVGEGTAGSFATCWICDIFHELVAEICGESQRANAPTLGESLHEHEDYWRDPAGEAQGIPYSEWGDDPALLGPGLVDMWEVITGATAAGAQAVTP